MDFILLILAPGLILAVGAPVADRIIGPLLEKFGVYKRFGI